MKALTLAKCLVATLIVSTFTPTALALTQADADSILYIKQEEKVARDAYQALHALWGHTTFANIAESEQRHMDAMDGLIARYKLTDTTPAAAGEFTIEELQALYDALVAFGSESLENALLVGVLIEETDIADLQAAIRATKEKPVKNVLNNLLDGSYNHLDAFNRALNQL
jgi:hypothetical protein